MALFADDAAAEIRHDAFMSEPPDNEHFRHPPRPGEGEASSPDAERKPPMGDSVVGGSSEGAPSMPPEGDRGAPDGPQGTFARSGTGPDAGDRESGNEDGNGDRNGVDDADRGDDGVSGVVGEQEPPGASAGALAPSDLKLPVAADTLDVSGLSQQQVRDLKAEYARSMLHIRRKTAELEVEGEFLSRAVQMLNDQARTAQDSGLSVTASHGRQSELGSTEVVIGNTNRAASGVAPAKALPVSTGVLIGVAIAGAILFGLLGFALAS